MKKKLVSIIIRTKNEERWIASCLNAVYEQDYKNFEVIIVDNYSKDNTLKIIKDFKVSKILKIKNFLPGKALNLGINNSQGSIIVCLSGHCIPKNEKWLSSLIAPLKNENIAGVYGKQEPLSFSSPLDKRDLLITFGLDKKIQKKDSFFHNANSAIKKKIWNKYKFDEKVKNIEDRLWGNIVIKNNYRLMYEPKSIVFHHHGIHHEMNIERAQSIINIIENIDRQKELDFRKPINELKIACIIPSKGNPLKFKDKFLIEYTFKSIMECKYIKKIYLATDSTKTLNIGKKYKKINPFMRPKNFSKDYIDLNSIIKFTINKKKELLKYDLIIIMDETYPMRPKNLLEKMLYSMIANKNDSAIAIRKESRNLLLQSKNKIESFNYFMPSNLKDSFGLISLYGLCCISTPKLIMETRILGKNPNYYEIKSHFCTNQIKTEEEFKFIYPLLKKNNYD